MRGSRGTRPVDAASGPGFSSLGLGSLVLFSALLPSALLASSDPDKRWLKDEVQGISYICPYRGSISIVVSQYNNKSDERVWDFACKATFPSHAICSWTDYINRFGEGINFSCPSDGLICGVENLKMDKQSDRKWRFYCCEARRVCFGNCAWSEFVNSFNEYFSWEVPDEKYLVGIVRYHGDGPGRRRWQFRYCSMLSLSFFDDWFPGRRSRY